MKILIYSRAFLPQIGGLEIVAAQFAEEFARRGDEVVLVTTTNASEDPSTAYLVRRNPGPLEILRWMRWCDVYFHVNVSLRGFWPLLLVRRPWIVSHQSWYRQAGGRIAWQDRLKRFLLRHAAGSISISRAIAEDLATPSVVINNSYRDGLFCLLTEVKRSRELVFVGRLVSDKGADILLEALHILAAAGNRPGLTIVGDGPERPRLEAQAHRLGLQEDVRFLGTKSGQDLVQILNQHQVMVVPSRYNEPFGIVALEGAACGCVVVGSEGGGLKEAIGPCGPTFPNGDAAALAKVLELLPRDPVAMEGFRRAAHGHLAAHSAASIMDRYVVVFRSAAPARC